MAVDIVPTSEISLKMHYPDIDELKDISCGFGVGEIIDVRLLDSSHDENDIRWNYIIDNRFVLRICLAPEMTEERFDDLNRLIGRYNEFGLLCPSFVKGTDGRFIHSWNEFSVYASEYVDNQTAEEYLEGKYKGEKAETLRKEVILSIARFCNRFKNVDLSKIYGMYSLFDLSPFDIEEGIDEKQQNMNSLIQALENSGDNETANKLKARNASIRNRLKEIYEALPRCVTQGDENFSNVLVNEDGKFVGLIDFNLAGTDVSVNLFANNADFNLDIFEMAQGPFDPEAILNKALESYESNMKLILDEYSVNESEKEALPLYSWIALASQWPYLCEYIDKLKREGTHDCTVKLLNLIAELDEEKLSVFHNSSID